MREVVVKTGKTSTCESRSSRPWSGTSFAIVIRLTLASATKGHRLVSTNPVIVLCYDDHVEPGIARSMLKNRWGLIDGRSVAQPLKLLMRSQPQVVVVQVPASVGPVPSLISRLTQHWNPTRVVAAANSGASDIEMVLRQSGADCFLPSPIDSDELEAAVSSLASGVQREGSKFG